MIGGFLPRWLYFTNAKRDFSLTFQDAPNVAAHEALMSDIARLKKVKGAMSYTDEAKDAYHEWYQSKIATMTGAVASCCTRLASYAQKIALVFEAVTSGGPDISLQSCQMACKLSDQLKGDLIELLDGQMTFNPTDRLCNKFVKMLEDHGGEMSHSRALKNMHIPAKQFKADVITTLVERGDVVMSEVNTATKPQLVYQLVT